TLVAYLDAACGSGSRRRTTDVESTHRELCTRLTDRLSGDDTNRFTNADRAATGQIASVAGRADTVARLAGDRRADQHLIHALLLEHPDELLIQKGVISDEHLVGARFQNVLSQHAAEYALTQRLNDVTALDERSHPESVRGTAVRLGHDQILSHVNEP